MDTTKTHDLAIVGAGPAGLEMALAAAELGLDFVVLERGRVAEHVRHWGFVNLFSPWRLNVSERGLRARGTGDVDPEAVQTGREYAASYLLPVAETPALRSRIHESVRVLRIGRAGAYKNNLIGDPRRADLPFLILADRRTDDGSWEELTLRARAVVDASGVFGQHRWLGNGGIPCLGERAARGRVSYAVEDLSDRGPEFDGKHVAVVGRGYSAITMLEFFERMRNQGVDVRVSWIVGEADASPAHVIEADPLPYRKRLGELANRLAAEAEWLDYLAGWRVESLGAGEPDVPVEMHLIGSGDAAAKTLRVDHTYAMVGYAPDRSLYEELQIHECYATSGPMKLAASLLAQSGGDCLTLESGGPDTLRNPEPGFFIIGAKSYGRNGDFLIERLREQVEVVSDFLMQARSSAADGAQA